MTHTKALLKLAAVIEECFEKDPLFLCDDNYFDYLEACKVLNRMGMKLKPNSKIVEYMAEGEMFI